MRTSKEKKLLLVLSLACAAAVIGMILSLCMPKEAEENSFIPPLFDSDAVLGEPRVPSDLGYGVLYQEGMSFRVGICGEITVRDHSADVYLTNHAENNVWLKVRFYAPDGNILGESGLIRPGEYLKSVILQSLPTPTEGITLKVMSYEPNTYHSMGSVTLTPKITRE